MNTGINEIMDDYVHDPKVHRILKILISSFFRYVSFETFCILISILDVSKLLSTKSKTVLEKKWLLLDLSFSPSKLKSKVFSSYKNLQF